MSSAPIPSLHPPGTIRHSINGTPSATWRYLSADGQLLGLICRFDIHPTGKEVLPYTCRDGRWAFKGFDTPRPLYNLPRLAANPTMPVLLVEGEKTADAAQLLFPDYVAMCWQGGANGIGAVDFSPLKGRAVTLWPDNDKPGIEAMENVAKILTAITSNVRTILPPDLGKGWDLADAAGWTVESAKIYLQANIIKPTATMPTAEGKSSDQARRDAERYLLGAMLRDVELMHSVIGGLNVTALTNIHTVYGPVFAEIIKQYNASGNYSVLTIEKKTGADLGWIASDDTAIELPWALEHWWSEYSKWATLHAYSAAVGFPKAADALAMRENVAKAQADLGLNWTRVRSTAADDFEQWGLDKIAGKPIVSNMRNPIAGAHEYIEYFEPGYATVISGDTSMGKSQYGFQLYSTFTDQEAKGIYDTLEMPTIDPFKRLLGIRHGINPKGHWQEKDFPRIIAALAEVKAMPNRVEKIFAFAEIEAACAAAKFSGGINFLFIDLLKYVTMNLPKSTSREEYLSTVTASFIALAGRWNIHVFLLHHLNGDIAKRPDKRPCLDDLRDSKAIKQDVANVIFFYRPAYYGITKDANGQSLLITDERGNVIGDYAEMIIAKNRNGALGTVPVRWSPIRGYRDLEESAPPAPISQAFPSSRVEPGNTPF